ncbi:hypothetical protein MBENS4_4709, partial [Novosphingobium sp. MBES04]
MKRSCQRHTQVFDLPVAAMIAEVPQAIAAQKHDTGAPDMFLRAQGSRHDVVQALTVGSRNGEADPIAHPPRLARLQAGGNPQTDSFVAVNP